MTSINTGADNSFKYVVSSSKPCNNTEIYEGWDIFEVIYRYSPMTFLSVYTANSPRIYPVASSLGSIVVPVINPIAASRTSLTTFNSVSAAQHISSGIPRAFLGFQLASFSHPILSQWLLCNPEEKVLHASSNQHFFPPYEHARFLASFSSRGYEVWEFYSWWGVHRRVSRVRR